MAAGLGSDLGVRAASGAVLAVAALGSAMLGGWVFVLVWAAVATAIAAEWVGIVAPGRIAVAVTAGSAVAAATLLTGAGWLPAALLVLVVGLVAAGYLAGEARPPLLAGLGVLYAAAAAIPLILLRPGSWGLVAVLLLFGVVWSTDVMAYVTGRTLGGPKLWPAVSPKKTWSGFLGGTVSGALIGMAIGLVAGAGHPLALFGLSLLLAAVSQGGDLLESALKRRFDVKDSSHLIPGHGGVMDRLDGFLAAALLALLIALVRAPAEPSVGLMVW